MRGKEEHRTHVPVDGVASLVVLLAHVIKLGAFDAEKSAHLGKDVTAPEQKYKMSVTLKKNGSSLMLMKVPAISQGGSLRDITANDNVARQKSNFSAHINRDRRINYASTTSEKNGTISSIIKLILSYARWSKCCRNA